MSHTPHQWATTPPSAKADAALRVAALAVCGYQTQEHPDLGDIYWQDEDYHPLSFWLDDWNRDDLARVFAAALRYCPHPGKRGLWRRSHRKAWELALHDPRAALCALLELLGIEPPAEICNNDGEREGRQSPATPNT